MKRSASLRPATIGLIGLGVFALAGCKEDPPVDVNIFASEAECQALPGATPEACGLALQEAMAEHERTAPRYDSLEYCEEQHGAGACTPGPQVDQGGGGSIFMPLLAGYMMGRMLGGGFGSKPLYPSPGGGMTTADKGSSFGAGAKSGRVAGAAMAPGRSTIGAPPMSKAAPASRGGFGSSGSGGGSMGG